VDAPALVADGVWWRYHRGPWLLRDLSVRVASGELLRVRGGNGAGKSTLLRLLAGCVVPHRGSVTAHPRQRNDESPMRAPGCRDCKNMFLCRLLHLASLN